MLDPQYRTGNKKLDEKIEMSFRKNPLRPNQLQRIMSAELPDEVQNKYHVSGKEDRTYSDGTLFASKGEMERWYDLVLYQKGGQIKDLRKQVPFVLQESFISKQYGDVPAITYVADFVYINISLRKDIGERECVEDHKGGEMRTDAYRIKRKMFLYKYGGLLFFEV